MKVAFYCDEYAPYFWEESDNSLAGLCFLELTQEELAQVRATQEAVYKMQDLLGERYKASCDPGLSSKARS